MNTCVFIFVPTGRAPDDFRERLRDCIASLSDEIQPASVAEPPAGKNEPPPFWTWFVPNSLSPERNRNHENPH